MEPGRGARQEPDEDAPEEPLLTRTQARQAAGVFVVVSLSVAILVFDLAGGLHHGADRPASTTLLLTGGWTLAAVLLTWLACTRAGSIDERRLVGGAALAPMALFLWMTSFHGTYVEPFEASGFRCLGFTIVIATVPLFGFMLLRRGPSPRSPEALGAIGGAMCGAWAAVVVELWCPLTSAPHALVGHVAPLALLVAAGALVGGRVLGGSGLPSIRS